MTLLAPRRGEIWYADFGGTRGHEQAGPRPALVVSADRFNSAPSRLAIVVPLTTAHRRLPAHVPLGKLSTGLRRKSFAMCEQIRVISHDRLDRRLGAVADATLAEVGELLKWIIDLA